MKYVSIQNDNYQIQFNKVLGEFESIKLYDGIRYNEILSENLKVCDLPNMDITDITIINENKDNIEVSVEYKSKNLKIEAQFEIYNRGYIICTFNIIAINDNSYNNDIGVGISLNIDTVFSNYYEIINNIDDKTYRYNRAFSVNFSTDERPITNSTDFILESLNNCKKINIENSKGKILGWNINEPKLMKKGYSYSNRWCVTFSSINNSKNIVRGQRIYHFNGMWPRYPSVEMLQEMAEYGCSILVLHLPAFKHIDGSIPYNEEQFKKTIKLAHKLNMKVMFYCQPLLMSLSSDMHSSLKNGINNNGKLRWNSMKHTQIIFYEPYEEYDCDEVCLRCDDIYDYMKNSVLNCYFKYEFDGLYIDFAWPSQAVCTNLAHSHKPGLYNFYDYLRIIREWRSEIGQKAIMIGHGGSIMVSSDFIEGFDGCLTGEGQNDFLPNTIGQQNGNAPTLWALHRKKQIAFRSKAALAGIIKEGITPHIGLGILGKAVVASHDPAHVPHFIALWQMWRAFPVEKATYYNYLTKEVVEIDNEEVTYSLYVTDKKQVMIIICNGGGAISEKMYSVGVNIKLNTVKLDLPEKLNCWSMRGNTYETFRITKVDKINNGIIRVDEIGIHEFIGFILSPNKVPIELKNCIKHLEGRFTRLGEIYENKIKRLTIDDDLLKGFHEKNVKYENMDSEKFMKNRIAE